MNLGSRFLSAAPAPRSAINYELNQPETLTAFQLTMQGDPGQKRLSATGNTCQFQSYTDSPVGSGNPISPVNPFVCLANVQGVPAFPGVRNGAIQSSWDRRTAYFQPADHGNRDGRWGGNLSRVDDCRVRDSAQPQGLPYPAKMEPSISQTGSRPCLLVERIELERNSVPISTAPITLITPADVALNGAGICTSQTRSRKVIVVPANPAVAPHSVGYRTLLQTLSPSHSIPPAISISETAVPGVSAGDRAQPGYIVKVPAAGVGASKVNTGAVTMCVPAESDHGFNRQLLY